MNNIEKLKKGREELDKQIYKEGEPTWGCKSGVLDVEDVKEFIKIVEKIILNKNITRYEVIKEIKELAGEDLK